MAKAGRYAEGMSMPPPDPTQDSAGRMTDPNADPDALPADTKESAAMARSSPFSVRIEKPEGAFGEVMNEIRSWLLAPRQLAPSLAAGEPSGESGTVCSS